MIKMRGKRRYDYDLLPNTRAKKRLGPSSGSEIRCLIIAPCAVIRAVRRPGEARSSTARRSRNFLCVFGRAKFENYNHTRELCSAIHERREREAEHRL